MVSAKLGERLLSWVLDAMFISVVIYFLLQLLIFIQLGEVDVVAVLGKGEVNLIYEIVMVVVVWVVVTIYQYMSHKSIKRATLGQMIVGIQVLKGEGEGPSRLFLRDLVNFWLWMVSVGFWLSKRSGQTYYDDVFNVRVVKIGRE